MRIRILAVLALLSYALAAIAQSPAPPAEKSGSADTVLAAPPATPSANGTPAADGDLQLVVALFRHGIRAPLVKFADHANEYSKEAWPTLPDWGAVKWGDLTEHGSALAETLGSYYASWYSKAAWPAGFSVYLWADVGTRPTLPPVQGQMWHAQFGNANSDQG